MTAWENEWKLKMDLPLMGNPDVARFRLVRNGSGSSQHYRIEHEPGELGEPWKDCCLVPRGNKPLIYDQSIPLPPWNSGDADVVEKYDAAIKSALDRSNSSTNRLETELDFDGEKRWAVLFMLREAVANGASGAKDLLIVHHGKGFKWSTATAGVAPIEDGTGHGDSR
jgi:hypothetical protein